MAKAQAETKKAKAPKPAKAARAPAPKQPPFEMHGRTLRGTVTSDKMEKTIVVEVTRLVQHPIVEKYIRRSTVVKAHDEKREAKEGDEVEVIECRPLSKTKRFLLARIIRKFGTPVLKPGALTVEAQVQAKKAENAEKAKEGSKS